MGDRCWLSIEVKEGDLTKFEAEFLKLKNDSWQNHALFCEYNTVDGVTTCIEEEANYGYYSELESIAKTGVLFRGYHTSGGDYGEMSLASDGENIHYCYVSDGLELVPANGSGDKEYQMYLAAEIKVEKYFKET